MEMVVGPPRAWDAREMGGGRVGGVGAFEPNAPLVTACQL